MICLLTAAGLISLAAETFTLSWQHSTARTLWTETWEAKNATLRPILARIEGPGAGMEAPEGAWREGSIWIWHPQIAPLREVHLAASGTTGSGWRLCAGEICHDVGTRAGTALRLSATEGATPCPLNPDQ
ncbi:DUF1850 domain-containing protein [Falsigemmobacter faecalis]|uniref:DUF1850 domain-containing protein n=1 Tax=Falsigemmobacter faecalis TaxID=2488730 RepID=A0A3P3DRS0_9RHOB|nr:DUF1850 domain-containing protein [Falsigemmobacter faecalis]RRH76909.1 DUF1850 domain-containing protein [Falsigemmobacter faecalis]